MAKHALGDVVLEPEPEPGTRDCVSSIARIAEMGPLGQFVDLLAKAVGRTLARCCAPVRPGRRHTFKSSVSCYEVPDLREISPDSKRQLWWPQEDYESFLSAHVEVAEAYAQAVERGEAELFRSDPLLSNDSRRGLGLGRGPSRASNAQAYFAAVMGEQDRQRYRGVVDCEALSRVAGEASLAEVRYSVENAARDAEDTRKYMAEATCLPEDQEAEARTAAPAEVLEARGASPPPKASERTIASGAWLQETEADAPSRRLSDVEDVYCDSFGEAFPSLVCQMETALEGGGVELRPLPPQPGLARSRSCPVPNYEAAMILSGMEKADSFPTFPDAEPDADSRGDASPESVGKRTSDKEMSKEKSKEHARGFGLPPGRLQEAGFLASGRQGACPGSPQPWRLSSPRADAVWERSMLVWRSSTM